MAKKLKKAGKAVGKGGVNPAPREQDLTVRVAAEQMVMMPISDLVPYANNARVHSRAQIAQLRASLREFGFVTPVLIDWENNISERAAAERAVAEHAAAERAAAVKWDLSKRERAIVRSLGERRDRDAGAKTADGCNQSQWAEAPE